MVPLEHGVLRKAEYWQSKDIGCSGMSSIGSRTDHVPAIHCQYSAFLSRNGTRIANTRLSEAGAARESSPSMPRIVSPSGSSLSSPRGETSGKAAAKDCHLFR